MAIGRVDDEHAAVPSAGRTPGALDVRDEEGEVLLRELRVELATEAPWVHAGVTMVAWRLVLFFWFGGRRAKSRSASRFYLFVANQ